jgi:cystathionine beta-synthase
MRIAQHISELIGGTPLVRLNSVVPAGAGTVVAKVEYLNPGGSSKDRIAAKMIDAAEASGQLKPGGTIVEPTSGNTGVGLALVAQHRGYKCVFVCPDKVSEDKRNVLVAYGADVVVCPTAVPPDDPQSYYSVSDRLVKEIDGAWKPDQYANPAGPASHPFRRRHRHRRDDHRRGPLPQGGVRRSTRRTSAHHRRRPRRIGVFGRQWPALSRRGGR